MIAPSSILDPGIFVVGCVAILYNFARAELNRLEQLFRDESRLAHASETQAWRAVADVLLNLDEFLTRE